MTYILSECPFIVFHDIFSSYFPVGPDIVYVYRNHDYKPKQEEPESPGLLGSISPERF